MACFRLYEVYKYMASSLPTCKSEGLQKQLFIFEPFDPLFSQKSRLAVRGHQPFCFCEHVARTTLKREINEGIKDTAAQN